MADVSKLKKSGRLGAPPSADEASTNLLAPETAPAPVAPAVLTPENYKRPDGRSARKTHRTLPFATRVSPDFDRRIRELADRDNLMLVEVMERALDAYEASTRHPGKKHERR